MELDYKKIVQWAETSLKQLCVLHNVRDEILIRIGYLYAVHDQKKKINEYQAAWREKNKDRSKLHAKKYNAKEGVRQKKREYAKKHYKSKKQQQNEN